MRLAQIVSNQSRAILVIVALLCAAGLYGAWQLPVAIFTQTDFPRIVIIADNGEAPASQTLVSVTWPIEEAMNGVPGIARIKSKTARHCNLYHSAATRPSAGGGNCWCGRWQDTRVSRRDRSGSVGGPQRLSP